MGREVFVSYKYSDALSTREEIRRKLGKEGHYYNGEKGFVALEKANTTIKEYLKEMIFRTSVTIVIISPNVKFSNWVDWEIRYSLRQPSRDGTKSFRNGIVCVIQNQKDWMGYENTNWAKDYNGRYRKDIFPTAIIDNLQTTFPNEYDKYMAIITGNKPITKRDYCIVVGESTFKSNPSTYIEKAFEIAHSSQYEVIVNKREY